MITLMYAILGCTQAPAPTTQVTFLTGDVAACRSEMDPEVCYRAAVANPQHPKLDLLLAPACRAMVADSCRRYYDHASTRDMPIALGTAMEKGCVAGDDFLCERFLEEAAKSDHPDQLEWVTNFVAEQRAKRR